MKILEQLLGWTEEWAAKNVLFSETAAAAVMVVVVRAVMTETAMDMGRRRGARAMSVTALCPNNYR